MSSVKTHTIPSFKFVSGDVLDISISYKELNPSASKKALIPTCFGGRIASTYTFSSASSPPASSLNDHHIILVAMLGNGESASPSNTPNFPASLDYRDQIHAQRALLDHLGIAHLDAVVGFSMGGQQAYHWAAMYPDVVRAAVCICGSARTSPHNYAFLEGPIAALERSADFAGGEYKAKGVKPVSGLRGFERAYAAWLYSAEWYRQERFKEAKVGGAGSVAEFIDKFQEGMVDWDAMDVLILARQWQKGDVGLVGGGYEETLKGIKAGMLVMPCKTDQYFPPEDSEIEMRHLTKGRLEVIPSIWGHAAGGGMNEPDAKWMDEKIADFLKGQN